MFDLLGTSLTKASSHSSTTTTLVPGITQPLGIAPLDLLTRYPLHSSLLNRFSPFTLQLDRYISPSWLPLALLGCSICATIYVGLQWKRGGNKPRAMTLIHNEVTVTRSIYLSALSVVYLVQTLVVILIDLDTAWDTGLLAWNQLACPLTHALNTASRVAIPLITLTLGIEVLTVLSVSPFWLQPIRWIVAVSKPRKAVHIVAGLTIGCSLFGLIETAYWRVQYYLPTTTVDPMYVARSSSVPLARCEVTGQFQYLFSSRVQKLNTLGSLDARGRPDKSTQLAASYADFKWIAGILLDTTLSMGNIVISLSIIRVKIMDQFVVIKHYSDGRRQSDYCTTVLDVKFIALILLIQGICRIPEALLLMLEPLTRPGEVNLTDSELEMDGTWQRYFMMLSTRVVAKELADMPAALMLPTCLAASKEFRRGFCQLFVCWGRKSASGTRRSTYSSIGYSPDASAATRLSPAKLESPLSTNRQYVSMGNLNNSRPVDVTMKYHQRQPVNGGEIWTKSNTFGTTPYRSTNVPCSEWATDSFNSMERRLNYRVPNDYQNCGMRGGRQILNVPCNNIPTRHHICPTNCRRSVSANDLPQRKNFGLSQPNILEPDFLEPTSYV